MQNEFSRDLNQEAIKAAVANEWQKAIELNQEILKESPDNVAAHNRLGIAYTVLGKKTAATKAFQAALSFDKNNPIAKNNLARLKNSKVSTLNRSLQTSVSFIEEPGKSKVIPLVSPGEPKVFSNLIIGETITVVPGKYKIKITSSSSKDFIGYLPDNISHRLIQLIKSGYKYRAIMKSVNPKNPSIFIQETHASKRLKGTPSFPLDDTEHLPNLSAGDFSGTPPLEIYDPLTEEDS